MSLASIRRRPGVVDEQEARRRAGGVLWQKGGGEVGHGGGEKVRCARKGDE